MPLWRIENSAAPDDPRWLGQPIWSDVIVRATTASQARLAAERMQLEQTERPQPVGNETQAFRSGFEDEKLYVVRPLAEDAAHDWSEDGLDGVLHAERLKA